MISVANIVVISVETLRIDIGCYLEKEFIELIHMNPWTVLYLTINQIDICPSYIWQSRVFFFFPLPSILCSLMHACVWARKEFIITVGQSLSFSFVHAEEILSLVREFLPLHACERELCLFSHISPASLPLSSSFFSIFTFLHFSPPLFPIFSLSLSHARVRPCIQIEVIFFFHHALYLSLLYLSLLQHLSHLSYLISLVFARMMENLSPLCRPSSSFEGVCGRNILTRKENLFRHILLSFLSPILMRVRIPLTCPSSLLLSHVTFFRTDFL